MSDQKQSNNSSGSIEILEDVVIKSVDVNKTQYTSVEQNKQSVPGVTSTSSNSMIEQTSVISCEKNLSEVVKLADPISPATAIQRNDVNPPNDDDNTQKIILDLVTSSHYENETQEEKAIAQNQLEELSMQTSRKRRKLISETSSDNSKLELQSKALNNKPKRQPRNKNKQLQEEDLENEDLVAILEGENEGHYEIVAVIPERNDEQKMNNGQPDSKINKDITKDGGSNEKMMYTIAEAQQQKGRKRKISPTESSGKITTLINSLVSDWDNTDTVSLQAVVEPKKAGTRKKAEIKAEVKTISESNKPRRIIKKKIIWDPDAPETHFPLASLVQPLVKQKQSPTLRNTTVRPITPKKTEENTTKVNSEKSETTATVAAAVKRQSQTPVVLNNKKKKLSETDKLLGDEGVSNMLNKLGNDETTKSTTAKKDTTVKKREIVPKRVNVTGKNSPASASPVKKETTCSPKKEITTATVKRETPTLRKQNTSPALQTATRRAKTAIIEEDISLPKKRTPKPKKDNWDFVYNQRNMDSMIIRRRSSSYSSTTSPRRLSLEHLSPPQSQTPSQVKSTATGVAKFEKGAESINANRKLNAVAKGKATASVGSGNSGFEFAKPETKQSGDDKELSNIKQSRGGGRKITVIDMKELPRKSLRTPVTSVEIKEAKPVVVGSGDVEVKKYGNVIQLIVHAKSDETRHSFTPQILKDLTKLLEALSNDLSCLVVVITSDGPNFCQGIDYTSLIISNAEKRKIVSQDMAKCVRDFLKALICFPKPLIAGIQGACSDLGVTMLPLFDIVISSNKSTFETTYARSGQIPEGHCVLSLTNNVRHVFKTRLFWLCEKINSTEAVLSGLVTKNTPPDRVQEDTLTLAKKIASLSSQAFHAIKSQRFKNELSKLLTALDDEEKILVNHWTSTECQEKFKSYSQSD